MDPQVVTLPSPLRRRVLAVTSSLLILVGIFLLGAAFVAATRPPVSHPDHSWPPANAHAIHASSATTAAEAPSPTVATGAEHVHPTLTPSKVVTREPSPIRSAGADPRPRSVPHHGEGFFEPYPDATENGSPYRTNTADQPATRISVPAVGIETGIVEVAPVAVQAGQQTVFEWQVADWAAGHHATSANPGDGGNIVISGHDDVRGEVFRGLHDIEVGDEVILTTDSATYRYVVQEIHMRRIATTSLEEQLSVGGFIAPMPEERVTLVTCWPYRIDTHRMIVVAKPAG